MSVDCSTCFYCRMIKSASNASASPLVSNLMVEGEIILDVDGTVPTQPVFQHIGISGWPGESLSVLENL